MLEISIIVPTRNRPEALRQTLSFLQSQSLREDRYEILVMDDGSEPPVRLENGPRTGGFRIIRLGHGERSAARNHGAAAAAAEVLAFVDDDVRPAPSFLEAHLAAQKEWPGALVVGTVSLPERCVATPFGRFRAALERTDIPPTRGPVRQPNFCTASNMSLSRARFLELGGFDVGIACGEDQDFALRHTARGGTIVFLPEAKVVHEDESLDVRSYCRRAEWGAEHMVPFCQRHPDLPDNRQRVEVNGPVRWSLDSTATILKKALKDLLAWGPALETLFASVTVMERCRPGSRTLPRLYRLLLGIHLQRGFRRGLLRPREKSDQGSRA